MNVQGKKFPTPRDYVEHPIWRSDHETELEYPLLSLQEKVVNEHDLSFRTRFTTPTGHVLDGMVIGISDIYAAGIFIGDEVVLMNRHLRDSIEEVVEELIAERMLPPTVTPETFFPLRYRTMVQQEPFIDRDGVLDFRGKL
jgi:hypothetical protein